MDIQYFPCIADSSGKIRKKLSDNPMTRKDAEDLLKRHYWREWLNCEAIPQPTGHHYFR